MSKVYYTASGSGPFRFRAKVFRFTDDLSRMVIMHHSLEDYPDADQALSAACQWCLDNGYADDAVSYDSD